MGLRDLEPKKEVKLGKFELDWKTISKKIANSQQKSEIQWCGFRIE